MRFTPIIIIIIVALGALIVLSLCPWGNWSGGDLKDFNLFGDLLPEMPESVEGCADNIDPELKKIADLKEPAVTDSVTVDTLAEEKANIIKELPKDFTAPRIGDVIAIEDYSADGHGLSRLGDVFGNASQRNVRIAVVGDSYIEGDILVQDIRSGLQDRYGGKGVGYIAAFSSFPGFRSSVNQAASNWEEHEIRKMNNDPLKTILGTYFTAQSNANARFRKSLKPAHLDSWERTRVLFKADTPGTISLSGPDFENKVFDVSPSDGVQCISLDVPTGDIRFTTDIVGLKVLGFWLENKNGIVVDGISLRGNSGISHRQLNAATTTQMRRYVDYDLIILEFGMNALSAAQTDYTAYGNAMVDVVNNLKNLYPESQILIFGVGDRGQKKDGTVGSMATVKSLIRTQRNVALRTGSLFWDTREAMGGEGAAVDWHQRHLLNSDYVHLNHRGGKELAEIFLSSFDASIKKHE